MTACCASGARRRAELGRVIFDSLATLLTTYAEAFETYWEEMLSMRMMTALVADVEDAAAAAGTESTPRHKRHGSGSMMASGGVAAVVAGGGVGLMASPSASFAMVREQSLSRMTSRGHRRVPSVGRNMVSGASGVRV